jgi:allantoin racemase
MTLQTPRRYVLINPNTNALTTQRLQNTLLPRLPPGVHLDIRTARFGSSYIACEASHAVAAHACLDAWAEHCQAATQAPEGVLIGCFGDPGLFALREASGAPVTGLAEASFIQAAALGPFAIVTGGERWRPMLQRLAQSLGYGDLLRHIETVVPSGAELQADPAMALQCLSQACRQASQAGVKAIIMGGAGLAGYAALLQDSTALPLIDSAHAGLDILLQGQAPQMHKAASNGFYAHWSGMSEGIMRMPARG